MASPSPTNRNKPPAPAAPLPTFGAATPPPAPRLGDFELFSLVEPEATKHGLPVDLILRQIKQESQGNPTAVSPKSAKGLMQLMDDTGASYGVTDPFNPQQNVRAGVQHMASLWKKHKGDRRAVLAEYNGGAAAVEALRLGKPWKETAGYLQNILGETPTIGGVGPAQAPVEAAGAAPAPPDTPGSFAAFVRSQGPQPPPAPPPGFWQGVKETVLPVQSLAEGRQVGIAALTDPLGTAWEMAKGAGQAQLDQFGQAKERFVEGVNAPPGSLSQVANLAEAGGRAVAGALPVVGPMAAKMGEAFGEGNVAYGTGQVVGGVAAPLATSKLLSKVPAAHTQTGPIPLTRGERTGSGLSRFAETIVSKTIPGQQTFANFRVRQQQALTEAIDKTVTAVAGGRGSHYAQGKGTLGAIEEAKKGLKDTYGAMYDEIDKVTEPVVQRIAKVEQVPSKLVGPSGEALTVPKRTLVKTEVGGVQPETRGLKEAAIPILRRIKQEQKLIPPEDLQGVVNTLTTIIKSPHAMGYRAFQDARSSLLAIARKLDEPIPGKRGGLAKHLAKVTDEAMEQAAERSGLTINTPDGPMPLQEYVRATNALRAEAEVVFNEGLLAKMAETAPERLHTLLGTATVDEIAGMRKYLPHERIQSLKGQLVKDWFSEDIAGETLTPGVQGLPKTLEGPTVSGTSFRSKMEDLAQDGRLGALFSPQESKELLSLARVGEQLQKTKGPSASLIAASLNGAMLSSGPAAMLGLLWSPESAGVALATGVGTGFGLNLLARAMTHPEGATTLRKYLQAIGSNRRAEAIVLANQLNQYVSAPTPDEQAMIGQPPPSGAKKVSRGGPPPAPPPLRSFREGPP